MITDKTLPIQRQRTMVLPVIYQLITQPTKPKNTVRRNYKLNQTTIILSNTSTQPRTNTTQIIIVGQVVFKTYTVVIFSLLKIAYEYYFLSFSLHLATPFQKF